MTDPGEAMARLDAIGWDASLVALGRAGWAVPRPRPRFGHGNEVRLPAASPRTRRTDVVLLGCFHPSPHNTFTGRLTESMTDELFRRAHAVASA